MAKVPGRNQVSRNRKTVKKTRNKKSGKTGGGASGPKRRGGRKAAPRSLRVAKVLDIMFRELPTEHQALTLNDRRVLERIQNKLIGAVTNPLTEADLTNARRIAKKAGITLKRV